MPQKSRILRLHKHQTMKIPAPVFMLLGIVLLSFCACNKYDEGPAFSLRTKETRVSQKWRVDKATRNGIDIAAETHVTVNFKDNGSLVYADTLVSPSGNTVTVQTGIWNFDSDAENLVLLFTRPGGGTTGAKIWQILRLTTTQLWVNETVGTDLYRYELEVK